MIKRREAYRDGLLFYSESEVFKNKNAIVEVLYTNDNKKIYFVEIIGTTLCAHGYTIDEAIENALDKNILSSVSKNEKLIYQNPNFKFNVLLFRRLTKACKTGINEWLSQRGLSKDIEMTLAEFEKNGGGYWADLLKKAIND